MGFFQLSYFLLCWFSSFMIILSLTLKSTKHLIVSLSSFFKLSFKLLILNLLKFHFLLENGSFFFKGVSQRFKLLISLFDSAFKVILSYLIPFNDVLQLKLNPFYFDFSFRFCILKCLLNIVVLRLAHIHCAF